MEDFSDMLLLKLLNTSVTAADDNEKVCSVVVETTNVLSFLLTSFCTAGNFPANTHMNVQKEN